MIVKDAATGLLIVGSFDLCKSCGENFGDILSLSVNPEKVMTEFSFNE